MTELSTIHQRLFLSRVTKFSSHVCAVPYYERGRRVSPRNQHRGPVVGCAIWTWRIVEERGKLCSKEKKGRRRARCPVKSQGVVVVLVPYYDSECFSWPLRNFFSSFSSFIISKYTCTARCKSNNLSILEYRALHDPTYFRVNNKYCRTNVVDYELLHISPRERRDN